MSNQLWWVLIGAAAVAGAILVVAAVSLPALARTAPASAGNWTAHDAMPRHLEARQQGDVGQGSGFVFAVTLIAAVAAVIAFLFLSDRDRSR